MNLINKPDNLTTEVVVKKSGVGIRVKTDDIERDLSLSLAGFLVQELAQRMVEAAALESELAREEGSGFAQTVERGKAVLGRIGENYSVFNWKRVDTGVYETRAANGLRLSVFKRARGEWFAQVGDAVLNTNKPVSTKVEAIDLVENTLIST